MAEAVPAVPPTTEELRSKFEKARESGSASDVRAAAVAYYRARALEGATQPDVAKELGVARWTLAKWHQKRAQSTGHRTALEGPAPLAPSTLENVQGAELRRQVEGLGPRSPSRRFPPDLKRRISEWAQGELARGARPNQLAKMVGVPWESLSRWVGRRQPAEGAKLRTVRVVPSAASTPSAALTATRGVILRSPSGFVVEGLDVASLVEVLRQLG